MKDSTLCEVNTLEILLQHLILNVIIEFKWISAIL